MSKLFENYELGEIKLRRYEQATATEYRRTVAIVRNEDARTQQPEAFQYDEQLEEMSSYAETRRVDTTPVITQDSAQLTGFIDNGSQLGDDDHEDEVSHSTFSSQSEVEESIDQQSGDQE